MSATTAPQNATNTELVRWAFEMLNQHDVSAVKKYWSADTVERFPDRTCRGPEEIAAYFEEVFAAIPDLHVDIVGMAEQGEHVFVQWRLTGTHGGPLQGIAPTGKRLEIDGMDHFVIRDGQVSSNFVIFDQMQYARQMGLMPPDGSMPDKALKAAFNAKTKFAARKKS